MHEYQLVTLEGKIISDFIFVIFFIYFTISIYYFDLKLKIIFKIKNTIVLRAFNRNQQP
jgi:hypothetical protein